MIINALQGTGFILEHKVAMEFQKKKWKTINGRYYLDDVDGRARELDLIAYKVTKGEDIDIATVVLVSCKKEAKNTVALLSRKRPKVDPNADWEPVHWWTKSEPMNSYLLSEDWKEKYLDSNPDIKEKVLSPKRDIFAFQLVSEGGTAQNDKPIFDSVTCLMKALDHEITQLRSKTKKTRRIYQFVLCTVFDAPMVDVQYEHSPAKVLHIRRTTYFSRYIVNKKDSSALIHFIRSEEIDKFLGDLDSLHKHNAKFFTAQVQQAYDAIKTSPQVRKYFSSNAGWEFKLILNRRRRKITKNTQKIEELNFGYYDGQLQIEVDVSEDTVKSLNNDKGTREEISALLKEKLRYTGEFNIEEMIPF
ncbi:hypothetical protein [Xanthomonas euvesicatoria]|nr:hypothetical protein [Xanthomonas euvesicatoria]MBV6866457.1 hypothetical protein [Xanthomonas campestris pv. coriandri]MCE4328354.1 hypothetical protein [Xanthomonas campestris pv. coriandri]